MIKVHFLVLKNGFGRGSKKHSLVPYYIIRCIR